MGHWLHIHPATSSAIPSADNMYLNHREKKPHRGNSINTVYCQAIMHDICIHL